jgi:hypothetical protein
MPSDRTRNLDPARYGYTGVVAQQGRVILDRDFNAQQGLTADRIAGDAVDFVGPSGTPDDGFKISLPTHATPVPQFWRPPVPPPATSPPETIGGANDFLIAPGTMYVGGERVTFPAEQNGAVVTYSYFDQPDWLVPDQPEARPSSELVYLEVTEQEVSAAEDPDLLEVALGGPDTTQRLKLLRRVRRMPVQASDCASAWTAAVAAWEAQGWKFDPATMRLLPQVSLLAGFTEPVSASDPCDPVATGGYLGSENQLIRARINNTPSGTQLLWGYDNASFLYRVASVSPDFTTLTLTADPPDAFHFPQVGQWVEVLRTAAVLAQELDETDPTGQTKILRVVAEADGYLRQLGQPYGPVAGGTVNSIVLTEPLPIGTTSGPPPLFLRVWQTSVSPAAGVYTLQQTTTDTATGVSGVTSTGVTATVSWPANTKPADGAFWQIAVRPATPQGVYPEDLLTAAQAPDGPRRWVCPLAVINWSAGAEPPVDCRNVFDNLVALSRRKPGCCTVAIGPGDVTATTTFQLLIDQAAASAETVTVCLAPGNYALSASLRLDSRHNGLTLESCGGAPVMLPDPQADLALFSDGLIVVNGASGVTLRGLTLRPSLVQVAEAFFDQLVARLQRDGFSQATQILRAPYTSFGVRAADAPSLTLDGCTIAIEPTGGITAERLAETADLFAAAVFVQGNCSALKVQKCAFGSAFLPTYTRLAVVADNASKNTLDTFNRLLAIHLAVPASSPPPSAPSSPPPSPAISLDAQVSDALDLVVAKRFAGNAASLRFVIITTGVLAADSLGFNCELGDAVIRDSEFVRFTFATWFSATTSILRLQDNTVSGGVAGLWLGVPGATDPERAGDNIDKYYKPMILFEEYQLLVALVTSFPPPAAQSPPGGSPPSESVNAPFSLFLAGNQVDTRVGTTSAGASAALLLALYSEPLARTTLSSVIVSANRLCGGMAAHSNGTEDPAAPAALLTLPNALPCSITGNVILNGAASSPSDTIAPSLWLTVADDGNGTELLSVTGNVLQGQSDLALLVRQKPSTALDHWSIFNADPS